MLLLLIATHGLLTPECTSLSVDIDKLDKGLRKIYDLGLKDNLKLKFDVNPHPVCALEDESCTLDNNCCPGYECKMDVDRKGLRYTCQSEVDGDQTPDLADDVDGEAEEADVEWGFATGENQDSDNSLLYEIYRSQLEAAHEEEKNLLTDQLYLIKELRKPLSFSEIIELNQVREQEGYKREKELKELKDWASQRQAEERNEKEKKKELQRIAEERVAKVLKEEERQKLKRLENGQDEMQFE